MLYTSCVLICTPELAMGNCESLYFRSSFRFVCSCLAFLSFFINPSVTHDQLRLPPIESIQYLVWFDVLASVGTTSLAINQIILYSQLI